MARAKHFGIRDTASLTVTYGDVSDMSRVIANEGKPTTIQMRRIFN
jgi:hypothetical protein